MNLLVDPVKWGAQAALAITARTVKIGIGVVRTAELLLGRPDGDDQRYEPVATPPQGETRDRPLADRPRPVRADEIEIAEPVPVPQGERRVRDVAPQPRSDVAARRAGGNGSTAVVETEGAAAPAATLEVREPWDGYDHMTAADITKRLRESDEATKAVVRLYEQANKQRKSVLGAT